MKDGEIASVPWYHQCSKLWLSPRTVYSVDWRREGLVVRPWSNPRMGLSWSASLNPAKSASVSPTESWGDPADDVYIAVALLDSTVAGVTVLAHWWRPCWLYLRWKLPMKGLWCLSGKPPVISMWLWYVAPLSGRLVLRVFSILKRVNSFWMVDV